MKSKLFITLLLIIFNSKLIAQKTVSTSDNDFFINDTLRLDPSQLELVKLLPTEFRRTLLFKPKVDTFSVYYFISGFKCNEGQLKNKKKEGLWVSYFDSGGVANKINYSQDTMEGPCEYYYKTGQINATGQFKNDKKDGAWPYYNKDGTLRGTYVYKDGEVIGFK